MWNTNINTLGFPSCNKGSTKVVRLIPSNVEVYSNKLISIPADYLRYLVSSTNKNDAKIYHVSEIVFTPGIRILGTGSNTKNRVRQVTTTFSGEYTIFILSDRQRY